MIRFLTGALTMFSIAVSVSWFGEYVSVYHGVTLSLFWLATGIMLAVILILPRIDDK